MLLAARLRHPLPGQRQRVGRARGVEVGRHGFVFEIRLKLWQSQQQQNSLLLHQIGSLRLFDQSTLYPLVDASTTATAQNASSDAVAGAAAEEKEGSRKGGASQNEEKEEEEEDEEDWASYGLMDPTFHQPDTVPEPPVVPMRVGLACLAAGLAAQVRTHVRTYERTNARTALT